MAPNWSASHPDLKQGGFSIIWHEKAFVGGDRMTVRFTLMSPCTFVPILVGLDKFL